MEEMALGCQPEWALQAARNESPPHLCLESRS